MLSYILIFVAQSQNFNLFNFVEAHVHIIL